MSGDKHALTRTSPKGEPFLGICTKCGKTDLPPEAVWETCPNPSGVTESVTVVRAVSGAWDA